jgi:hypothetical protein
MRCWFLKKHRGVHSGQFAWCLLALACLAYGYNDLKQMFAGEDYVPLQSRVSMCAARGPGSSRRFTATGSRYSFVDY